MEYTTVPADAFTDLDGLDGWRHDGDALRACFRVEGFAQGASLVADIARLADDLDHHPDIDLRYPGDVHLTVTTHAAGDQVTDRDVDLARRISAMASRAGGTAVGDEDGSA